MVGQQLKNKLIPVNIDRIKRHGMHLDGKGLYLCVSKSGAKSWIFRYAAPDGKRREMGLGPYPDVSLAEARDKAEACRKQKAASKDPLALRQAEKQAAKLESSRRMTFRACAEAYIATHSAGWKNAKHAYQWPQSLGAFVYPVFGDFPVQDIDTPLVIQALKRIWREKTETAQRVRGRIERILDWARVSGFRAGENPARWRGHLDQLLPPPTKIAKVEHHAALPYAQIGEFMKLLRQQEGASGRALEFTILSAARTGEVIGARWEEFDLKAKVWTVPGERMKAGVTHRVPLSTAALKVIEAMKVASHSPYVFPGGRQGKPLSNMAMLQLLRRLGRSDLTVHGFRSSFRDWAAETTNFPREVAEAALAHTIENKVEAAYRRGELLEKRRKVMEAWACDRLPDEIGNVIPACISDQLTFSLQRI